MPQDRDRFRISEGEKRIVMGTRVNRALKGGRIALAVATVDHPTKEELIGELDSGSLNLLEISLGENCEFLIWDDGKQLRAFVLRRE